MLTFLVFPFTRQKALISNSLGHCYPSLHIASNSKEASHGEMILETIQNRALWPPKMCQFGAEKLDTMWPKNSLQQVWTERGVLYCTTGHCAKLFFVILWNSSSQWFTSNLVYMCVCVCWRTRGILVENPQKSIQWDSCRLCGFQEEKLIKRIKRHAD